MSYIKTVTCKDGTILNYKVHILGKGTHEVSTTVAYRSISKDIELSDECKKYVELNTLSK